MPDVVILSGVRTPIGAFQGALAALSATDLGATAIRAAIARAGIDPADLDEVIMGCVLTGGLGQAPARQASLGAGVPTSVPCTTVNKVCGSGMKAIMMAAQAIRCGDAHLIVAGGMESMTNAPYSLPKAREGYRMGDGQLVDLMVRDGLWDPYHDCHMGVFGDTTSTDLGITRDRIDAYAAESYRRALVAQDSGAMADEITSVTVPQRRGEPLAVCLDEEPARGNPAKFSRLKSAFSEGGTTTAGNASSINDGAAALVIADAMYAARHHLAPLARIVDYTDVAVEPSQFPLAPALAIERLLAKTGHSVQDIDLFEINEAFAVVALAVSDRLTLPADRVNVNGGAVALGHPIGMTGARLVLTAAHELHRRKGRYAIASPCIGGGEATAMLIEGM